MVGRLYALCVFFFQAEDGIRDLTVTGVQTCALPILPNDNYRPKVFARGPDANGSEVLVDTRLAVGRRLELPADSDHQDRKSTRLNSSHSQISYAVFCLKKKKIRQAPCSSPTDFHDAC